MMGDEAEEEEKDSSRPALWWHGRGLWPCPDMSTTGRDEKVREEGLWYCVARRSPQDRQQVGQTEEGEAKRPEERRSLEARS